MCNTHQTVIRCFIAVVFSLILPFSVSAQEVIDSVQYRAVYDFSYKTNPDQTEFAKADLMYLDIGQKITKFYSRYEQIRDSVRHDGVKRGLSPYEVVDEMRTYNRGSKAKNYTIITDKKKVTSGRLFKDYYYEETLQMPQWKLMDSDKTEIGGFKCKKAKSTYLGREWIVFYTPEIPYNHGPWKLWGLPGLILQATDSDNLFNFSLTGFEKVKSRQPLILEYKNSADNKFTKLEKQKYVELEKLFYKDSIEFMKLTMGNVTVTMTDEQAERHRKLQTAGGVPFIPLELE